MELTKTAENKTENDAWLSLVERYVRDVEVAGSNPVASIPWQGRVEKSGKIFGFFFYSMRELWEHFPIYSRFILISAATAIWRSDLDGCSDFISRRISTILTVRPASGNSGEDGIFPCPAGFWNISIFRLAATEKAKCVPASINLSYFYVPVSGMEPT